MKELSRYTVPVPLEHEVKPYFQPIVSMQTQRIVAYESLGRWEQAGQVRSLGPFFQNPDIPDERHLAIDRVLRERAIEYMAQAGSDSKLFINLKPSWIYQRFQATGELPTLHYIARHGLDPSRVVVEITEEEFQGRLDELSSIIELYRRAGCMIAIDDIGSGYSNYDRIASIRPHILKIDLKLLKKSATHVGYEAVLNSFSILASQMGSSLLVEGVETKRDLHQALKVGARYVQGFLFSEARAALQPLTAYEAMLQEELSEYTRQELAKHRSLFAVMESLNDLVSGEAVIESETDADSLIEELLESVEDHVVKVYICREDGRQISSNFSRCEGCDWEIDPSYRGANWIWRPYFIPNILQMNHQRQGNLSQVYTDLDSSRPMQTYSCPIGGKHYLFLDLVV
ncbi:EAL domain-containing protein [Paenibacillus silviterrae]|uniref:EAL domain-containing protein n=1 Tax=Paenibacillus silviterrae TaxID=3242194 RepID=UPI002543A4DF|nr:EAL domain-containing protein [Paenibacillus chinjuensis]